ncbi:MAG: hypothetical protein Q9194_001167 [Teloschistes cf. exilis]
MEYSYETNEMAKSSNASISLPVRNLEEGSEKTMDESKEHKMDKEPVQVAEGNGEAAKDSASTQQNGQETNIKHPEAGEMAGKLKDSDRETQARYIDLTEDSEEGEITEVESSVLDDRKDKENVVGKPKEGQVGKAVKDIVRANPNGQGNVTQKSEEGHVAETGKKNFVEEQKAFAEQLKEVQAALSVKLQNSSVCMNCLGPGSSRCKRCEAANYCSLACQQSDWIVHKKVCKGFTNHKNPPEPGYIRALLFPESEAAPQWIWLKETEDPLDMDFISESLEVKDILGVSDDREIAQQQVLNTLRRAAVWKSDAFESRAFLLTRLNCFKDGSKPNQSIGTVTGGHFLFSWRGPIIVVLIRSEMAGEGEDGESFFDHLGMIDFRDIINFFLKYGRWVEGVNDFAPPSFWWMSPAVKAELGARRIFKGVQINSNVEAKHTGEKFRSFFVPEGHPALAFLRPCPVTARLGLPLVMRRAATAEAFREEGEAAGNWNSGPGLLELCIEPQNTSWGMSSEVTVHGNMAVCRQDMEDLHPHHVEAMICYLGDVVYPAMEESIKGTRSKQEVLDMIHPSRFDWFFMRYRKEQSGNGKMWAQTPDIFEKARSANPGAAEQTKTRFPDEGKEEELKGANGPSEAEQT